MDERLPTMPSERQAAINAPAVVVALLAVLVAIQAILSFLSDEAYTYAILLFSFLPARYDTHVVQPFAWPGGSAADIWTFVTYAFLHGDWIHLGVNGVWLLAFGSAVAWRFGTLRFLVFSAICAACGAALHLAFHWGEMMPVIGAWRPCRAIWRPLSASCFSRARLSACSASADAPLSACLPTASARRCATGAS